MDHLFVLCERVGPVRHFVVVLGHSKLRTNLLFSAYPIAAEMVETELRIVALNPWQYGVEGTAITSATQFKEETLLSLMLTTLPSCDARLLGLSSVQAPARLLPSTLSVDKSGSKVNKTSDDLSFQPAHVGGVLHPWSHSRKHNLEGSPLTQR